ncbi:MAG: signal peptidase II [Tissierellia bacterium]|nr:signal peptidase II [Tissierellia bacterium]
MTSVLVILALVALDQLSKFLVVAHIKGTPGISVLGSFFRLIYLENTGAAFGILQDSRSFFIVITLVVSAVLIYELFIKKPKSAFLKWALVFIFAGTLGNFIDRLRLHYVVDFISLTFGSYSFAVFNLADTFIVVGTFMVLLHIFFQEEQSEHSRG